MNLNCIYCSIAPQGAELSRRNRSEAVTSFSLMVAIKRRMSSHLLDGTLVIDITGGLDLPGRTLYAPAAFGDIESLTLEVFEARGVRKAQQMAHAKGQFAEAKGVGRMDIALDDLVVHQPVDDVGTPPLGRAKDGGVPQQVALVAEGIDAHALALAEIFVRVVGVQGINANLEFLPVARGEDRAGQP